MQKRLELQEPKWRMKMNQGNTIFTALKENHATNRLAKLTLGLSLLFLGSTVVIGNAATANTSYLKSVAITDAAGSNAPPAAVINYTKQGDLFTFDASQSSDTDGTIVSYKWKFDDGSTCDGAICTPASTANTSIIGQLTVEDNSGGVTLAQIQVPKTAIVLQDTFSEATLTPLANHKPDLGGTWHILDATQPLVVSTSNYMKNTTTTGGTLFYNDALPNGADYTVSAQVNINSAYHDRIAGPCIRVTPQGNGYCAYLKGTGEFILSKHLGGSVYGTILTQESSGTSLVKKNCIIAINALGSKLIATLKDEQNNTLITLTANDSSFQEKGFVGGVIRRKDSMIYSIEGL